MITPELATKLYPPISGLVWVIAKILLKRSVRRACDKDFDSVDALAWFGVDLSVLGIALCISLKIHERRSLTSEQAFFLYLTLVVLVILAVVAYHQYLRRSPLKLDGLSNALTGWLAILGGLLFGGVGFSAVLVWSQQFP